MRKQKNLYNDCNLPEPIFESLKMDFYEAGDQEAFCSTTSLKSPPKIFWGLKKVYALFGNGKIELPASSQIFSQRGQMVHNFFEKVLGDIDDYVVEKRLYCPFKVGNEEYIISGMFDVYSKRLKTLFDYKEISIAKYNRGVGLANFYNKAEGFDDYEEQLNIYAYIMDKSGYPVDKIEMIPCLRDWSTMEKRKQPSLPNSPYGSIKIRKWSEKEVEDHVAGKIANLLKYKDCLVNDIPECSIEDRWEKPEAFKVFKYENGKTKGNALAGSAKLDSRQKAQDFIDNRRDVKAAKKAIFTPITNEELGYKIVNFKADPVRCIAWCTLSQIGKCNYWKKRALSIGDC